VASPRIAQATPKPNQRDRHLAASGGTCCAKENGASAPTTGRMSRSACGQLMSKRRRPGRLAWAEASALTTSRMRARCLWLAHRIAHRRMTDQRQPFEQGGGTCSAREGGASTSKRRRVLALVRRFAPETKRGCSRVFLKRRKQNADLGLLPCHSGSYTELYGIRRES